MSPFVIAWIGGRPDLEPAGRPAWSASGQLFQAAAAADSARHRPVVRHAATATRVIGRGCP